MALIIGALAIAAIVMVGAHAAADTYTAIKAASVGEWATAERLHGRRLSQRFADAMAKRRVERRAAATPAELRRGDGTDGKDWRPGGKAYFGDLYHGFWERQIEKSQARRAAKGPYEYPGPLAQRLADKVTEIRERRGMKPDGETDEEPGAPGSSDEPGTPGEPATATPEPNPALGSAGEQSDVPAADGSTTEPDPTPAPGVAPAPDVDPEPPAEPSATEPVPASATDTPGTADAEPGEPSDQAAADAGDDNNTSEEPPMTTPTTAVEVNNNTDLRMLFKANLEDARELLDLVAHMETDLNTLAYSGREASDYTSSARFDASAAAAAADILSMVNAATITTWAELADTVAHTSTTGLDSLQKWLDTEQVIAEQRVDGSTLAAAGA